MRGPSGRAAGIEAIPVIVGLTDNVKRVKELGLGATDEDLKRWEEYHRNAPPVPVALRVHRADTTGTRRTGRAEGGNRVSQRNVHKRVYVASQRRGRLVTDPFVATRP